MSLNSKDNPEEQDPFDALLRQKLKGYTPPPPPGGWQKIDEDLHGTRFRRIVYGIAAALVLALTTATLLLRLVPELDTRGGGLASSETNKPGSKLQNSHAPLRATEGQSTVTQNPDKAPASTSAGRLNNNNNTDQANTNSKADTKAPKESSAKSAQQTVKPGSSDTKAANPASGKSSGGKVRNPVPAGTAGNLALLNPHEGSKHAGSDPESENVTSAGTAPASLPAGNAVATASRKSAKRNRRKSETSQTVSAAEPLSGIALNNSGHKAENTISDPTGKAVTTEANPAAIISNTNPQAPASAEITGDAESLIEPAAATPEAEKPVVAQLPETAETAKVAEVATTAPAAPKPANQHNWAIDAWVLPRYRFNRLQPNRGDDLLVQQVSRKDEASKSRISAEAGLRTAYQGIKIGGLPAEITLGLCVSQVNEQLEYNLTGTQIKTYALVDNADNNAQIVKPVYASQHITTDSKYTYGGLQSALAIYSGPAKRLRFSAGANVNVLVQGRTNKSVDGDVSETFIFPDADTPLEQINTSLNFSAGYVISPTPRTRLMIEPTLNYFIYSSYKAREPLALRPYTAGLNFTYRFIL
ncbi:MAG: hypothetical protein V4543_17580 [Bacteroidota bacterium]